MTAQDEVIAHLTELGIEFETLDCDPALADTAEFCEHYGYPLEASANTIIVASKRPPGQFVACLVLASTRLDVNGKVRELTGWKKASFARSDQTAELTGMTVGGVTPFALPAEIPLLVDRAVMDQPWVIVGAGSRSAKLKVEASALGKIDGVEVVEDLAG